ncbi:hypothetical protein IAQ61_000917 [Plenodomus lingam]|uniref:uncharacterized protein n=1 Tax=Leptosphaeria maculans TaxID=5022 RepID=UPI00332B0504|nr:hypothetical protein IAQ61_000917 [Plenodomus lingam]
MLFLGHLIVFLSCTGLSMAKHRDKKYDSALDTTPLGLSTDQLIFRMKAEEFQARRTARIGEPGLIWNLDGCKGEADRPFGWDCKFTHTNTYKVSTYYVVCADITSPQENKKRIDKVFQEDMFRQCKIEEGSQDACHLTASVYHRNARTFDRRSLTGRLDLASLEKSDNVD